MKTINAIQDVMNQFESFKGSKVTTTVVVESPALAELGIPDGKQEQSTIVRFDADKNFYYFEVEVQDEYRKIRVKKSWITKLIKAMITLMDLFSDTKKYIKITKK